MGLVSFSIFTRLGSLVIRTQHVQRDEYIAHLRALTDWQNNALESALQDSLWQSLPESIWMAELSAPELFTATRHKFGELLIAADRAATSGNLDLLLAARLPSLLLQRVGTNFMGQPTTLTGHTPLFSRMQ